MKNEQIWKMFTIFLIDILKNCESEQFFVTAHWLQFHYRLMDVIEFKIE